MAWMHKAIATWYGAAIIVGVFIVLMEWRSRKAEPSKSDVRRAAARYREHYGRQAIDVIGDHIFAASFAPDSRHRRFLKRVFGELLATSVTDEDRARAIEP
jgi:hypothetical protein